jgi:23S rRNA pseudouridine1911/1915/1917 synthase
MEESQIQETIEVPVEWVGMRLDQAVSEHCSDFSRNLVQEWIKSGQILVNNKPSKPKYRLRPGEIIRIDVAFQPQESNQTVEPENIELNIVYEDEAILIINKPAGLVVHPAAGHASGTLQNALLYHYPHLIQVPRAGIVHRLDKLTSGIMVVAKTLKAHQSLIEQLQSREVKREYQALVQGCVTAGGTVDEPIGRHVVDRKRMAVVANGKPAITHYRVRERFRSHTLLDVQLETGRTHQIRVHLSYIRYPIVGDPVYGGRFKLPAKCSQRLATALKEFKRQALHAYRLSLCHPDNDESLQWEVPLADDIESLLVLLRKETLGEDSVANQSDSGI